MSEQKEEEEEGEEEEEEGVTWNYLAVYHPQ